MKSVLFVLFLFSSFCSAFGDVAETHELAIIRSVDDFDLERNYIEVSEEGLPQAHYLQLMQQMGIFRFTLLSEARVSDLFEDLAENPRARMRYPGGYCSQRRAYIQNKLKKMSIVSGKIFVNCPTNGGHMRLKDQVSKHYYTFSNFHDANVVAIQTNFGNELRVMDVQFKDRPVSLQDYLTEIEASQKIRPSKNKAGSSRGVCYWSISTPHLTY
jgi:hypothetical protein